MEVTNRCSSIWFALFPVITNAFFILHTEFFTCQIYIWFIFSFTILVKVFCSLILLLSWLNWVSEFSCTSLNFFVTAILNSSSIRLVVQETGLISGLWRSPGEGNSNALQYSYLGDPMQKGACWATVHGITKELAMTKQLKTTTKIS